VFLILIFVCRGTNKETKGTAYIVYDDIFAAKAACENVSGFNLLGRYLIVVYWQPTLSAKRQIQAEKAELEKLKAQILSQTKT